MSTPALALAYRIRKEFQFESSHQLFGLPAGHRCMGLHGHNYRATITLVGRSLDDAGMVLDYDVINRVQAQLDHKHLNEVLKPLNPTAENVARWIFEQVNQILLQDDESEGEVEVERVSVMENDTSEAEVFLVVAEPSPSSRTPEGTDWGKT